MSFTKLLVEIEDGIATITLNRPAVLNALSADLLRELDAAILQLADNAAVRVILLHGAGNKAFAAGADIAELAAAGPEMGEQMARGAQRIFRQIETLSKPTIACIEGLALGGGCELALACTFRLATPGSRFGQPEIKLGIIPGFGGTQRLPRLVGRSAALHLILTGRMIDATEALQIGLIDEVIPGGSEQLIARARELATQIAAQPPLAVAAALEAVVRGADLDLPDALALEAGLMGRLCGTEDKEEGTQAFLQKRRPVWRGR